jgi:hypothetical protein
MTIRQQGGIFGRNPTFNIVTAAQFVGPINGLATSAAALKSSATTGLMQITGPAAGATRTMTIPDANFTAARTDAAQAFTGNQTLTDGNLIVSNGKGIDFSATSGTGTSELFNDYEEGTWTPTDASGAGLTIAVTAGTTSTYVKIGRLVVCSADVTYPVTADATVARLSLPFAAGVNPSGCGVVGFKSDGISVIGATSATGSVILGPVNTFQTNAALSGVRFSMTWTFQV